MEAQKKFTRWEIARDWATVPMAFAGFMLFVPLYTVLALSEKKRQPKWTMHPLGQLVVFVATMVWFGTLLFLLLSLYHNGRR